MLTLSRRPGEGLILEIENEDGSVEFVMIHVRAIIKNSVRISFDAPKRIRIWRTELYSKINKRTQHRTDNP